MPSIRVSDCHASGATQNENWPGSPTVKQNEGNEKKTMRNIIVRKVTFGLLALYAIAGLMSTAGCDEGSNVLPDYVREKVSPPPPIGISFRVGFLSDNVMQVHNLSDKRIMINIHVSYPPTSEEKNMVFPISPNSTEEYGALELDGWQFSPGGDGYVTVHGYSGRVNFKLLDDGKYRTW